jgi:hypothetical protein
VGLEVATAAGTEKEEEKGENPFGIGDLCLSVCLSVCVSVINKSFRARVQAQRERERERSGESHSTDRKKI